MFSFCLRLPCTFRSIIFFKSRFLGQNIGRGVILNLKKNLKKIKLWGRNCGFTSTPEVKVYSLIDSPMMLCNQPRRLSRDYIQMWRTGYSVDQPPCKHLPWGYYLGMNKPRSWKCPWTSPKKRKKRTKNENTAMSEQAKVGGKLKLRLSGIMLARGRVERWQKRCNDSTCSFWLACLFLSNPRCFSLTYQLKSFRLKRPRLRISRIHGQTRKIENPNNLPEEHLWGTIFENAIGIY